MSIQPTYSFPFQRTGSRSSATSDEEISIGTIEPHIKDLGLSSSSHGHPLSYQLAQSLPYTNIHDYPEIIPRMTFHDLFHCYLDLSKEQKIGVLSALPDPYLEHIVSQFSLDQLSDLILLLQEMPQSSHWVHQHKVIYHTINSIALCHILRFLNYKQKETILPFINEAHRMHLFIDNLRHSVEGQSDMNLVPFMSEEQVEWALQKIKPSQLSPFAHRLSLDLRKKVSDNLQNASRTGFQSYAFTLTDIVVAFTYRYQETYQQIIGRCHEMSIRHLLIAVYFCPKEDLHDLIDCESIFRILQLIPWLSRREIPGILEGLDGSQVIEFTTRLKSQQIKYAIPHIELELLREIFQKLGGQTLHSAVNALSEHQKERLTYGLLLENIPDYMGEEIIEEQPPYLIAIAATYSPCYDTLIRFIESLSFVQLITAVPCMPLHLFLEMYVLASDKQKQIMLQCLTSEQRTLFGTNIADELGEIGSQINQIRQEREKIDQELQEVTAIVERSQRFTRSTPGRVEEMSQQFHLIRNRIRTFIQTGIMLRDRSEFFRDFISRVTLNENPALLHYQYVANIVSGFTELLTQISSTTDQNSLAFQLERLRRVMIDTRQEEEPQAPVALGMNLYVNARNALNSIHIDSETLDANEISWEEIIALGIQSASDLQRLDIHNIEQLRIAIHGG